jgi:class 3 adenylate cyclase
MPLPNLDKLTDVYQNTQIGRLNSARERIVRNANMVKAGRAVPENEQMLIGTGRRITATVLFLDICKFSARPSSTEGEQELLLRIMSFFFTEMIRIIEDYGGTVEKNTGDGLMAYFVADARWADQVQKRALAAALTMFHAADAYINPVIESTPAPRLNFRICMDHGPITIARIGAAQRFNNIVAIGATANLASKMLGFAGENSILLGDQMIAGIPTDWFISYGRLKTVDTGWVHLLDNSPYKFWEYIGRWRV